MSFFVRASVMRVRASVMRVSLCLSFLSVRVSLLRYVVGGAGRTEDRLDERNDREGLRLLGGGALLLDGLLEPLNDLNVVGEEVADERPGRVQHDADAAPRVVEEPLDPPDDATDQREDVVEKQDDEAVDAVEEVLDLRPDGGEGLVDVLERSREGG